MRNAVNSHPAVSSAQHPTGAESSTQARGGDNFAAEQSAEERGATSVADRPDHNGMCAQPPAKRTSPESIWLATKLRTVSGMSTSSGLETPGNPEPDTVLTLGKNVSPPATIDEESSDTLRLSNPLTPQRKGKDIPPSIDVDAPCLYTSVDLRQLNRSTTFPDMQLDHLTAVGRERDPTLSSFSSPVLEKQLKHNLPVANGNAGQELTKVQGVKPTVPRLQSKFMQSCAGPMDGDGDESNMGTDFTRPSRGHLLSPLSGHTNATRDSLGNVVNRVLSPRSPGRPMSVATTHSAASDRSSRRRGHSVLRKRYGYVFLDFDHVLTTVMLGIRSKNFEIPPVERCTDKEFGGQDRVDKIRELFEVWEKIGVHYCIVSNGRFNRVRTCLERVDLLRYVENKIYCVDTESAEGETNQRSKSRLDKRDTIENVLTTSTHSHTPSDALFIDDSFANLCQAEDVCVVYQPEAGEYGNGLSLVELGHLVDNAKAVLLERQLI